MPVPAASGRKRSLSPTSLAVGAALLVAGVVGVRMLNPAPLQITVVNERQITSDVGLEFEPVLSPDGDEVVYSAGRSFDTHLYIKVLGGDTLLRLAEDLPGFQRLPSWTESGDSLRFWSGSIDALTPRASAKLGGGARGLDLPDHAHRLSTSWSPHGDRIVFLIGDSIVVHSADGQEVLLARVEGRLGNYGPHSFAWSPDGRRIAFVRGNRQWRFEAVLGNILGSSIWVIDADGGEPVQVTAQEHLNMSPVWLPDSRHLAFVSDRDVARSIYVMEVGPSGPRGEPQRLPGGSNPHTISLSADGKRLAYSRFDYRQNVRAFPIADTGLMSLGDGIPVTSGSVITEDLAVSPDGEWIAFDANTQGNQDIYKMRLPAGDRIRVSTAPGNEWPTAWSPDGTEIAFFGGGIWVIPSDGSGPGVQVSSRGGMSRWSPDGLSLLFSSAGRGQTEAWVVSRDRVGGSWGEPVPLTDFTCGPGDWAPAGDHFVCPWDGSIKLVTAGGDLIWQSERAGMRFQEPRFSTDGRTIYFRGAAESGSPAGIWSMPADRSADPELIIIADDPSLWYRHLAVGPEHIYLTVAEYQSDIWVMDLVW